MEIIPKRDAIYENVEIKAIVEMLEANSENLNLKDAMVYIDFPLYRDIEGEILKSEILLISKYLGAILIKPTSITNRADKEVFEEIVENFESLYSNIYSRLLRNPVLRKTKRDLNIFFESLIYAPNCESQNWSPEATVEIFNKEADVCKYVSDNQAKEEIEDSLISELIATIEGSKTITKQTQRKNVDKRTHKKGYLLSKLEEQIARFDNKQREGYLIHTEGLHRIRGLAGSGKTIILALKAAYYHIKYPDERIVYTYWTKNLFQQVKYLITRFYRQFDDRDPNWDNLLIMHGWGGKSLSGVYSTICEELNLPMLSFQEARSKSSIHPFAYACSELLKIYSDENIFDLVLVDEGQDFPTEFIQLILKVTKNQKVVWAYDELQTIFQIQTPSEKEIFGVDAGGKIKGRISEDTILYKVYRNPREVLLTAHALGFGFYGKKTVQILENKEHWEDYGYEYISGEFSVGSKVVLRRPPENSISIISDESNFDEIVSTYKCKDFKEEIQQIKDLVISALSEGLNPDDILIITMDDRNAKTYLLAISDALYKEKIKCHDVHSDPISVKDFRMKDFVTLSTIHKAKGNESYYVILCGLDAIYRTIPSVHERNLLFTAITRSKGWISITGIGDSIQELINEIEEVKNNFPNLIFTYPSDEELKIMKRDLEERSIKKLERERKLDQLLLDMSPNEIIKYVEQSSIKKES